MQVVKSTDGFVSSVEKALDDIDKNWRKYPGLIVLGTHSPQAANLDIMTNIMKAAREGHLPTLGICFGLQLGVIEFCRNVYKLPDANSDEIDPTTKSPVIDRLPGVRVGSRPVLDRFESHWHQYKVADKMIDQLSYSFRMFLTAEDNFRIVEEMRLQEHPFYVLTQYHPEYQSTPDKPHPLLVEFISACKTIN